MEVGFGAATGAETVATLGYTPLPSEPAMCRDRYGSYPAAVFNLITCALCYTYIAHDHNVTFEISTVELVVGDNMVLPSGTRMLADITNETIAKAVCSTFEHEDLCGHWESCCRQAADCCKSQILAESRKKKPADSHTDCPQTWDGFACFPDTHAGVTATVTCPVYASHPSQDGTKELGYKTCTENGTWYLSPDSGHEWTDYTQCSNIQEYKELHHAIVASNSITVLLALPACIIFLYFRQLRQQQRIRLHVSLLVSAVLVSMCKLIWELTLTRDRLDTQREDKGEDSLLERNPVWCRMLSFFSRYCFSCAYMWMLAEGFHLHRLLVHAFSVPRSLLPYFAVCFGFPVLPLGTYAIIRGNKEELNQKCWSVNAPGFEYIVMTPVLLALLLNTVFLLRIVYIMVRQLEPHPNEPNNFRRAVKAVGVLVPLFGVQLLLFLYRPEGRGDFLRVYELLSQIFIGLQGAFVALVFCFFNREVQGQLKSCFLRLARSGGYTGGDFTRASGYSTTTQYATELSRTRSVHHAGNGGGGDNAHIPLRPIYCPKNNGSDVRAKDDNSDADLANNGALHTIMEKSEEFSPLNPGPERDSRI